MSPHSERSNLISALLYFLETYFSKINLGTNEQLRNQKISEKKLMEIPFCEMFHEFEGMRAKGQFPISPPIELSSFNQEK
jgi:hypothetical protein